MAEPAQRILQNVAAIRERIAAAAARSGRRAEDVTLVAVTKYVGEAEISALLAAGCRDLGESRPQDLWRKAALSSDVRWHFVGHLQRNKVRRTAPLLSLLHSLDSQRLGAALNEELAALGRRLPTLLEVNVSGDAAKHGLRPAEVEAALVELASLPQLEIRGLMGMAGLESGPGDARRQFAALRELRDRLAALAIPNVRLEELSMGMSGDFEIAIEEGATLVRVGSALFEPPSQV